MRNNEHLLNYISSERLLDDDIFDCLRYELAKHVYYYGDHFRYPQEKSGSKMRVNKSNGFAKKVIYKINSLFRPPEHTPLDSVIMSNAYFNFNNKLAGLGHKIILPPWVNSKDKTIFYDKINKNIFKIQDDLSNASFNYLISQDFLQLIFNFQEHYKKNLTSINIKALIVPNDMSFFENISLKIFKQLGIPSFIFLHGLPGRYNLIDDYRSDYLLVWGEAIKKHYINNGMAPEKILVVGHPLYTNLQLSTKLRFSFEHVLLLTRAIDGSTHSDGVILEDRGNMIVYLLIIQKVLMRLGVKKAYLRPHPSEDINWYLKFLDRTFFIADQLQLNESLLRSTLVIGPTSSVFLEALYNGVNFVVFEPSEDKRLFNYDAAPPFDGSDKRVPLASGEASLFHILSEKTQADVSIFEDYIQPQFNVDAIKNIIN